MYWDVNFSWKRYRIETRYTYVLNQSLNYLLIMNLRSVNNKIVSFKCRAINVANVVYGDCIEFSHLNWVLWSKSQGTQSVYYKSQVTQWRDAWSKSQMTRWNNANTNKYKVWFLTAESVYTKLSISTCSIWYGSICRIISFYVTFNLIDKGSSGYNTDAFIFR